MLRKLLVLAVSVGTLPMLSSCGSGSYGAINKIHRDKIAYVGTVPFEPPLMYQAGADLVGPDAELGRRVLAEIVSRRDPSPTGTEIKLTWINRTYPNLVPALRNGEVDYVLGVFAVTEERKKEIQFSDPYYTSEFVLMINPVHKDQVPADLAGLKLGVREGSGLEEFVQSKYPNAKAELFKTLDDAVLALRRSEVDAVVDDKLLAAYSLATTPGASHMEIIPETLGSIECAVGMRKDDRELLELVNGVIAEVKKEGLFTAWIQEHAGSQYAEVVQRRTDRLEQARKAAEPRQVAIRISRDASFDFDIYKMANLQFVFRENSTGSSYSSSRIDFQGSTGVASVSVPPGSYTLSLPRFNFSTGVDINPTDPMNVPINIRVTSGGVVVRKG